MDECGQSKGEPALILMQGHSVWHSVIHQTVTQARASGTPCEPLNNHLNKASFYWPFGFFTPLRFEEFTLFYLPLKNLKKHKHQKMKLISIECNNDKNL